MVWRLINFRLPTAVLGGASCLPEITVLGFTRQHILTPSSAVAPPNRKKKNFYMLLPPLPRSLGYDTNVYISCNIYICGQRQKPCFQTLKIFAPPQFMSLKIRLQLLFLLICFKINAIRSTHLHDKLSWLFCQ